MDESRWRRLRELFEAAQRLAPEEREAFLDEACAGEPEIRREVESLLRSAPRSRDPIGAAVERAIRESGGTGGSPALAHGRRIGHYVITGAAGAGGMGEVYVAQDLELRRRVALKVLAPWISSGPESLRRFKREARALAALNHPNIVTIYSVDRADDRRPVVLGDRTATQVARGGRAGARRADAAGLWRAATARPAADAGGAAGSHAAADGAGARGVRPHGGPGALLAGSEPLSLHGGPGDAPGPRRPRTQPPRRQAGRPGAAREPSATARRRASPISIFWLSTRPCSASRHRRGAPARRWSYVGGLSYREIAVALGISEATVDRDMRFSRAWPLRELE